MDGASMAGTFRSAVITVSVSGIATPALLCVISEWNGFFLALMLTSTQASSLPMFVISSKGSQGLSLASASAASPLVILRLMIVGWIAQKSLAQGLGSEQ